jgi:hypothetical protein
VKEQREGILSVFGDLLRGAKKGTPDTHPCWVRWRTDVARSHLHSAQVEPPAAAMKTRRKEFPRDREVVWIETSDGAYEQAVFSASAMEFERGAKTPIPAEVTMAWERHDPRARGTSK